MCPNPAQAGFGPNDCFEMACREQELDQRKQGWLGQAGVNGDGQKAQATQAGIIQWPIRW